MHLLNLTTEQLSKLSDALTVAVEFATEEAERIENAPEDDGYSDEDIAGAKQYLGDMIAAQAELAPLLAPDEPEPQQPGTHRVTVNMKWGEYTNYETQVEIDVPDGFEEAGGDVIDLLEVDDNTPSDLESVPDFVLPEGYTSNWLKRASFDVEDVNDREIGTAYIVKDDVQG